jgi:anaerobic magnesium-protoporphyrin IX monomethyl ester cyclase
MKVLLISNPNTYKQKPDFPPPGIAYLGSVAKNAGHQVKLIDSALYGLDTIISIAKEFNPDVIGVTCWTINRHMVWELCSEIKKNLSDKFLILGGPHATALPEHIFKKTHASAVVLGEGEETFVELLEFLSKNKSIRNVRGLALREVDNSVFYTGAREPIKDISLLTFPYYEGFVKFKFSKYNGFVTLPSPCAAVISSRGCVYNCTFCGSINFWGNCWRKRSADDVLDEIKWLIEKYNIKSIYFFDDNFPVDKNRVRAICRGIIDNNWKIKWACCSHIKLLNRELLEEMKESGCISIDFGVESGSDLILKNINKKQTRNDIINIFKIMNELNMTFRTYLMVGNKGESLSTINETIEMFKFFKYKSSIGASILWLLPGTEVYSEAKNNKYINDDYWMESDDIPYNLQEHSLEELKYFRDRLMVGIARNQKTISSFVRYYLKKFYYKYSFLSNLRSLIPKKLR